VYLHFKLGKELCQSLVFFAAGPLDATAFVACMKLADVYDQATLFVLQPLRWRCVECAIHHERDVHEE